jgi:hypothetical protein
MELPVVGRLVDAINAHDLDALAGCFAEDFRCEWPAHPQRSFSGADQVRRNWEQRFARQPDVTVTVVRSVVAGNESWGEWHFTGAGQPDDRGVIVVVATPDGRRIQRTRFFMEPVS